MARKKSAIGLPVDMSPDDAYIQGMSDGLTETIITEPVPDVTFSTFAPIGVPIGPVRMELAALHKDGFEYMPLSDFLLLIHRLVKEDQNQNGK